jgi:hypothetical protein
VAISEQELVISYILDKKEFNDRNLHPTSLASFLCCFVIPVAGLVLLELILLIVGLVIGFDFILTFFMIIIPSIYGAVILLFIPTWLIVLKLKWSKVNRLPKDQKWIFSKEGITIDKTYSKSLHPWIAIQHVTIRRFSIYFGTSKPRTIGLVIGIGEIQLRYIEEEQYEELLVVLRKYLDESKILIKVDKKKMKFKKTNSS